MSDVLQLMALSDSVVVESTHSKSKTQFESWATQSKTKTESSASEFKSSV